jgi:hypothetical protein
MKGDAMGIGLRSDPIAIGLNSDPIAIGFVTSGLFKYFWQL